jgi:hypothetical protein
MSNKLKPSEALPCYSVFYIALLSTADDNAFLGQLFHYVYQYVSIMMRNERFVKLSIMT